MLQHRQLPVKLNQIGETAGLEQFAALGSEKKRGSAGLVVGRLPCVTLLACIRSWAARHRRARGTRTGGEGDRRNQQTERKTRSRAWPKRQLRRLRARRPSGGRRVGRALRALKGQRGWELGEAPPVAFPLRL